MPGTRAAWAWQDAGGFRAFARATAGADPTPAFQEPAGSAIHDVEYCWLAGSVELWVDGTRVLQQSRAADVPHPDSLWFGNNVSTGDPGGIWNPIKPVDVGLEYVWGKRETFLGEKGDMSRINFMARYNLN